jgi:hypothetical protein
MQTTSPDNIVREIAESTDKDELVSKMYADAFGDYRRVARSMDYVSLFAAKTGTRESENRGQAHKLETISVTVDAIYCRIWDEVSTCV